MLVALTRAIAQMTDPVLLGVLGRSVLLALLAFAGLFVAATWLLSDWIGQGGWLAGLIGGLGAILLALWFFIPAVVLIATLFIGRVANAVEQRFYPGLPPATGAPFGEQGWDAVALGTRLVLWQAAGLVISLLLPGVGLVLSTAITGWAIGRGLFVGVAMRRLGRPQALALYRTQSGAVIAVGILLALVSLLPPLNLLVPVVGIAAMVHLFCLAPAARAGL